MNTKHYLVISGIIGGVIGSLLAALLVSPVSAQRDKSDNFGHIECTSLSVVDAQGKSSVILGITEHGGTVGAFGKDGIPLVVLNINEHGGMVAAYGNDGESMALLTVDELGGAVDTWDKYGRGKTLD